MNTVNYAIFIELYDAATQVACYVVKQDEDEDATSYNDEDAYCVFNINAKLDIEKNRLIAIQNIENEHQKAISDYENAILIASVSIILSTTREACDSIKRSGGDIDYLECFSV